MPNQIAQKDPSVTPHRLVVVDYSPLHCEAVTDGEFWHDMVFGMLVGTPLVWLLSAGIALSAGVGLANAAVMAMIPAFFCGTFYGGLIPLMGRLIRAEGSPLEISTTDHYPHSDQGFRQVA